MSLEQLAEIAKRPSARECQIQKIGRERIDGIVALIRALERATTMTGSYSFYLTHELEIG